jgi:hypothetical protein
MLGEAAAEVNHFHRQPVLVSFRRLWKLSPFTATALRGDSSGQRVENLDLTCHSAADSTSDLIDKCVGVRRETLKNLSRSAKPAAVFLWIIG